MKKFWNRELGIRTVLTLFILLSGVAMVPYIDLPKTALSWKVFAGIYSPELVVDEPDGGPGSVFVFTGSNYPPNSVAGVYVNGRSVGTVNTDVSGSSTFLIDAVCAAPGLYNITMEVDINASATQTYEIVAGLPALPGPIDPTSPMFPASNCLYLPKVVTP